MSLIKCIGSHIRTYTVSCDSNEKWNVKILNNKPQFLSWVKLLKRILLTHALPPSEAGWLNAQSVHSRSHLSRPLLIERAYYFRKDLYLYIGFINLKDVFDTVCHTSLWNILQAPRTVPKIMFLFKLLNGSVNGRDFNWFTISSRILQSCVEAPDLFNCITDHLMCWVYE